jgi:hypothetical protein
MVSRDGRPFPGHVATTTSIGIDKTSLQRHPSVPASSYPIKGQARALKRESKKRQKNNEPQTMKNQSPFVLSFFL